MFKEKIISLRVEMLAHKRRLTQPLFIEVSVQIQSEVKHPHTNYSYNLLHFISDRSDILTVYLILFGCLLLVIFAAIEL
jgi:hypothetical protein